MFRFGAVQKLEFPNQKKTENVRGYLVLQRYVIPANKHAPEKGATRDPHDEMAP